MRRRVKSLKEVDNLWEKVEEAFDIIYKRKTSSLSFQKLFDIFHVITISKFGHVIHQKMEKSFKKIITYIEEEMSLENENAIPKFCELFEKYLYLIDKVQKIAVYYDSRYVLNQPDGTPSSLIGYLNFRDVFLHSGIVDKLIVKIIENVSKLRNGDYSDKLILREVVLGTDQAIFEEDIMNIKTFKLRTSKKFYKTYFEPHYISSSVAFYQQEVQKIDFSNCHEIIEKITKLKLRFEDELDLAQSILDLSSESEILGTLDVEVIQKHSTNILENLPFVLEKNYQDKFQALLRLFLHSETSRKFMYKKLQEYTIEKLQEISENKSDKEMVKMILKFRKKMHTFLKIESYKGYKLIIKFIDDQLRCFIANEKLEKNIVKYFHFFLSKIKWASEDELNEFYEEISDIVTLIYEKTLFSIHYVKFLQKRLLAYEESTYLIYETKIIDTLKFQGIQEFTSKFDIPINDLRTSFLMNRQFETYFHTQVNKGTITKIGDIQFKFKVLTADFWDFKYNLSLRLPKQVQKMKSLFERFFHLKFKQRKLLWKDDVGKASLKVKNIKDGKKLELVMNTIQACICMAFNKHKALNFEGLKLVLNMTDPKLLETELKGLLYSKILVSTSKEKVKDPLKKESIFSVNENFSSKRNLVKVKAFRYVEKEKKEDDSIKEKYVISKRVKINSCLMRIMKSGKKMKFSDLMPKAETFLQEFFMPTRMDLLRGLEELINKEFLLRDEEDHNLILYS